MDRTFVSGAHTSGMARVRTVVVTTVFLAMVHGPAVAAAAEQELTITGCTPLTLADGDRFSAPQFEKFGVNESFTAKPARLILHGRQARRFRTQLREGAAAGPNFAGHYTVVAWGCGTSCVSFAIVDAKSGRVFFPPDMKALAMDNVGLGPNESEPPVIGLRHRRNSRLLIVLGAPNEDQAKEGITYYEWTGNALKPLLFLRSVKTYCPDPGSAPEEPQR